MLYATLVLHKRVRADTCQAVLFASYKCSASYLGYIIKLIM